jgi:hypothetical protein
MSKHLKLAREYDIPPLESFKTWNPESMPDYPAIAIYARRREGKTHLMKDFLHKVKNRFDVVYCFSLTARFQDIYEYVPKSNIVNGFDTEILDKLVYDRMKEIERLRSSGNVKLKGLPKALFIFDDVITEAGIRTSKSFASLFSLGRHARITVCVISQKITSLPPIVRNNTDVVISFFLHSELERKMLCEEYLSVQHWRVGEEILKMITEEEYNACVICLHNKGRKYEDYVFTYKAPEKLKNFKLGEPDVQFKPMDEPSFVDNINILMQLD